MNPFKDLTIYIPTLGRADKQLTYSNLSPEIKKVTKLVIHKSEKGLYNDYPHIICPEYEIAAKRQWIIENCPTRFMAQLDDDLHFYIRKEPGKWNLRYTNAVDINSLFENIIMIMEAGYIHVGVSDRAGNNRVEEMIMENQRMMRFLVYDIPKVRKHAIFGRMDYQEDFDICLQLLRKGYKNAVIYEYAQGNPRFNAKGGCEVDRTIERHNRSIARLAELHPDFVTIRKKNDVSSGEFNTRNECICHWKKAYESSQIKL
jgi:hypothetical protein